MFSLFRAIVIACIGLSSPCASAGDPEVIGDRSLLELCANARKANSQLIAKHGVAEIQIDEYLDRLTVPITRATVRCKWASNCYYSDLVIETYVAGTPSRIVGGQSNEYARMRRDGRELDPISARALADGKRYLLYYPAAVTPSGHLEIFRTEKDQQRTLIGSYLDQRPHIVWSLSPRVHSWDKWMDLDDRKNPFVVKWEIVRRGHEVVGRRTIHVTSDGRDDWGVLEFVMDLTLAGQVVSFKSGGKTNGFGADRQTESATYRWERMNDQVVVLRSCERQLESRTERKRNTYKLLSMSLAEQRLESFVEPALRVRPGARVDDKIKGTTYAYGGLPVTQGDLNQLVKEAKQKVNERQ